jgi:hypothetical protein
LVGGVQKTGVRIDFERVFSQAEEAEDRGHERRTKGRSKEILG